MRDSDKLNADEVDAVASAIEGGIKSATPKLARAAAMLRQLVRERDAHAALEPGPICDTAAFLSRMLAAAEAGEPVAADDVARLRKLADWADAPPPAGWNGTLDRGETRRAVEAARGRAS